MLPSRHNQLLLQLVLLLGTAWQACSLALLGQALVSLQLKPFERLAHAQAVSCCQNVSVLLRNLCAWNFQLQSA